jgi:hypothetical protein
VTLTRLMLLSLTSLAVLERSGASTPWKEQRTIFTISQTVTQPRLAMKKRYVVSVSNSTQDSTEAILKDLASYVHQRGVPDMPIPTPLLKRIRASDSTLTWQQYRNTGNLSVSKTATHLPDSSRKSKGDQQSTPITSFYVKKIVENTVIMSPGSLSMPSANKRVSVFFVFF